MRTEPTIVTRNTDAEGVLSADVSNTIATPDEAKTNAWRLKLLCERQHGLGLAAPQIGLPLNMFWAAPLSELLPGRVGHMVLNPRWTPAKKAGKIRVREGCLSLPGEMYDVERYTSIDAVWNNTQGHTIKRRLTKLAAWVFQHETDHLRGVMIDSPGVGTHVPGATL